MPPSRRGGAGDGDAGPEAVFAAVVAAASALLDGRPTSLARFEDDGSSVVVAAVDGPAPLGARIPPEGDGLATRVRRTGRAARVDDYDLVEAPGPRREWGLRAAVAAPVRVDGRLWGFLAATSRDLPLPAGTEQRLDRFTDIVAASIGGAQARRRLRDLAAEQSALRRVAELVARGANPDELFAAVAAEAAALVDEATTLVRLDGDRAYTIVAAHGGPAPVGTRIDVPPDDEGVVREILRTRRPARLDDYGSRRGPSYARDDYGVGSSVGVPIIVDDRVWGVLGATSEGHRLPDDAEPRLAQFAELVGAAVSNAQARAELLALADEQAALRRLAELAAREASVPEVLDAVAREASWLAGVSFGMVLRFEPDGASRIEALSGAPESFRLGMRSPAEGDGSAYRVWRTGRAARADDLKDMSGTWPRMAHRDGYSSSAAAPMRIGESLWGALVVVARDGPLAAGLEDHLSDFCELAGTVIAAAESKAKLTASRARVVAGADEARRRVQRDVHDTAQQRLVHTVITLKLARAALAAGRPAEDLVEESIRHAEQAGRDLRDAVRGIFPAALTRGGLRIGIEALVDDLPLPVDVRVDVPRLPPTVETTVYVVVAEALANVVKHAGARRAAVDVRLEPGLVVVDVRDDGSGGADLAGGSGLTGLLDRVEAGAGRLTVTSPPGGGTLVHAVLPLPRVTGPRSGSPEGPGGRTGWPGTGPARQRGVHTPIAEEPP